MQQVVFFRGVITSSILHVRCNNVCRITWEGVCAIWIFQTGGRKFCVKTSIQFFTIILSFGKTKFFFRNSCFPVRSVFVFNVSLFTSGVCCCQNGLRRKHGNMLYDFPLTIQSKSRLAKIIIFRSVEYLIIKGDNRKYFPLYGASQTQTIIRTWKITFFFY